MRTIFSLIFKNVTYKNYKRLHKTETSVLTEENKSLVYFQGVSQLLHKTEKAV
jgi:hypothetical protein